ncbi:type II toxin-antitoxin system RelE/ParE family toxin [Floccifex sp.]|uniref:type II toxin-antitoxin system RelE/ParE family toxin n=1 Tax=Floccifex sp. TaxID=2815810 RepID=UPI003F0F5E3A
MNYIVRLTDTAKQDLSEILFWIANQSKDKEIAKHFVEELMKTCKKLGTFPNMVAFPKDRIIRSAGYRFIIHKDYLIFYLVDEEEKQVNIMAIFNVKKDYMRVMKKYI